MKAIIAIDSFKGSIDSIEAGEAAAQGIRRVYPDAQTFVYPLADGGEGTVQAMAKGQCWKWQEPQESPWYRQKCGIPFTLQHMVSGK